ncbi:NAD-dependent succinate-semialdehyde dehydrogenase [Paracoccaceae bacterium GXU_MW_L88]
MSEITTINPATEEVLKRYPLMSDAEMDGALGAAHAAYQDWRKTSFEERAAVLRRIGEELRAVKGELGDLMTREMGKLRSQTDGEVLAMASECDYLAENGARFLATEEHEVSGRPAWVSYCPQGVIYGIQPWNFPVYQALRYTLPNLMAGNTVLLSHADNVTGCALMLGEILARAGVPEGAFGVLLINHEQSDKLIADARVRGVTFTGSFKGGSAVGRVAGEHAKKTVMELGSNDAFLVLDDANLKQAVRESVTGRIYNNGQTCVAAKRFIVTDGIYDDFRDAFTEAMAGVKYGDPFEKAHGLGPLAREDLRDNLHEQVQASVDAGAKLLTGGVVPNETGYYYPATVLEDVEPGQPAYEDELFGPAAALIRAKDDEDAMRIANDSRFGLGGGIFSEDVDRARSLAIEHFDTGMVNINGFGAAEENMPFGGTKDSGFGREHGAFGIREFVNIKAITMRG